MHHFMFESIDELFFKKATTKTTKALDPVKSMVHKLEWIVSRPARLLECLVSSALIGYTLEYTEIAYFS